MVRRLNDFDCIDNGLFNIDQTSKQEKAKPSGPTAPKLIKEVGNIASCENDCVEVQDPDERGDLKEDEQLTPPREV